MTVLQGQRPLPVRPVRHGMVWCGHHLEAYEQGRVGLSQWREVSTGQLERLFDPALLHQLLELAAAGRNTETRDSFSGGSGVVPLCWCLAQPPARQIAESHIQDGSSLVKDQHLVLLLCSTLQC